MAKRPSQSGEQSTPASTFLFHQWVAAGIISGAARFIPIPLVDDLVRSQCRRFVISRTLSSHNTPISLDDLKPYYAAGGGCLSGCVGKLMTLPLKLLLFPIRKLASVVTSVRGVPLEITRLVLLGRTLDRYLRQGELGAEPKTSAAVAARMKVAFDEAFSRMDFRVIRAAMSDALSGVSGWQAAATNAAKKLAKEQQATQQALETEPTVDTGAERIQEVLARPEMLEIFAEFDRRFDDAFRRTS